MCPISGETLKIAECGILASCKISTFRIVAARACRDSAGMSSEFKMLKVAGGEHGNTLQDFLCQRLGLSRKQSKRLLDDRVVFVNHQRVWMAKHPLNAGDIVEARKPARQSRQLEKPLLILHEDDDYLIIDKPAGMLANGPGSAESRLQEHFKNTALEAVHRLDRDTSGCFLLAKNRAAFEAMVKVFQERAVSKTYIAIARGYVPPTLRTIRSPIEHQEAVTHLRVLRSNNIATLLQLDLETGRTHQIRRHLSSAGHPLVGDKQYETRAVDRDELRRAPRQMLHAEKLAFKHPRTGALLEAETAAPNDFKAMQRALGL